MYLLSLKSFPSIAILFDFFNNEKNIEKFIEFLSLEEKKGKDKFNAKRFILFKVSRWYLNAKAVDSVNTP